MIVPDTFALVKKSVFYILQLQEKKVLRNGF